MTSSGPFLVSDITIESPQFRKKLPSLQLSCSSSPGSVRSACSTNENDETTSIYSEESSGFRQGSDSGTVISCPLEVPQSSPSMLDEVTLLSLP
uniref:SH2 domain-containing protein n=1 Tax=Mesocestoides corti TaxID=53468 RepID=A0A5K3FHD0_MESCO